MISWHTKKAQKILSDIFGREDYNQLMNRIDRLKSDPYNDLLNIPQIRSFVKVNLVNKMNQKPENPSGFKATMNVKDIMFDENGPVGRLYHSPGTKSSGNFSKLIYNPLVKNRTKEIDDNTFKEDCKKLTKKYLSLTKGGNQSAYEDLILEDNATDRGAPAVPDSAPQNKLDKKTEENWDNLKRKKNKDILSKLTSDRLSNVLKTVVALIIYHWADTKLAPQTSVAPQPAPQTGAQPPNPPQTAPKDLRRMNEWIDILSGGTVTSGGWRYKSGADMRKDGFNGLESHHDYIQVFFPNKKVTSTQSNKDLYLDSEDFKEAWQRRKGDDPHILEKIQNEMKLNFKKMLTFWGFLTDPNITFIIPNEGNDATARRQQKICSSDHNNLRVTRVLLALRNFGLNNLATTFYNALKGLNPNSEPFWAQALNAPLPNL